MDILELTLFNERDGSRDKGAKIPWNDPEFSQRMLANHLSQEHDWASRKIAVIEQQILWIARQLSSEAKILDLGCGPGLYTQRLAQLGFDCTGVDFSPASIRWAQQQAQAAGLTIDYQEQDVRHFSPGHSFDFIMMTFGELNVFSAEDAEMLLRRCAQWLKPGGKLLIEAHSYEEVKRQGRAEATWQRCPQGLFLAEPHLLLSENRWDEATQTSLATYWAVKPGGEVIRFDSQMHAWRDEEYFNLLISCGLQSPERIPAEEWPVSKTFEDKLFALLAVASN